MGGSICPPTQVGGYGYDQSYAYGQGYGYNQSCGYNQGIGLTSPVVVGGTGCAAPAVGITAPGLGVSGYTPGFCWYIIKLIFF